MTVLSGTRVLVTGASSGIGFAVAQRCGARGARVLLTGRAEDRLREAADHVPGPGARWCVADLTLSADVAALLDWATEVGPPDVVVHSAGLGLAADTGTTSPDRAAEVLTTNLSAPILLTERFALGMVRRGDGHLVFVTSVAGLLGAPREGVYAASKAGLHGYARSLRAELGRAGVRVSTVATGPVATEFFDRRGERYGRRLPRPLAVHRVADAVLTALERDVAEVVLPRWLRIPIALSAVAPQTYARLESRWA